MPFSDAFPPKIWPVTLAESIITLFFEVSPLFDSPPKTLPSTVALSLIVMLFSFAVPVPLVQPPEIILRLVTCVFSPEIVTLLPLALLVSVGLLTLPPLR